MEKFFKKGATQADKLQKVKDVLGGYIAELYDDGKLNDKTVALLLTLGVDGNGLNLFLESALVKEIETANKVILRFAIDEFGEGKHQLVFNHGTPIIDDKPLSDWGDIFVGLEGCKSDGVCIQFIFNGDFKNSPYLFIEAKKEDGEN